MKENEKRPACTEELREAILAEARGMTEEQRKMFILFLEAIVGAGR